MGEHYIQYNIFLGVRPDQGVLFHVSDELENVYIRHIGFFPRSFEQLAYGLSYYQHNQALVRSVGYMTCFCYADSMDDFCNHPYILSNSCASVNIICTDDEPSLDIICRGLHSIHNDRCLYLALKEQLDVLNLPNSFTNSTDAVSYLRKLLPNIINENPVPIPDFAKGLDR